LRNIIIRLVDANRQHKIKITLITDLVLFVVIFFLSYYIRLGEIESHYVPQILFLLAIYIPIKLVIFWQFKLYKISYRYFSLYELQDALKASLISAGLLILLSVAFRDLPLMEGFPRSVALIDFLLTFLFSFGLRFGYRVFYQADYKKQDGKRILIVGAGNAGVHLLNELKWPTNLTYSYVPVAFVDDDPEKLGNYIRGLQVVGNRKDIPKVVEKYSIEGIIISIPTANSSQISEILEYCRESGIDHIRIMPGLPEVIAGKVTIGDFKEVSADDFLGRKSVNREVDSIFSYIKGKRVMVTGAGGSIGSELCRQISGFEPELLILVDVGDTELFYINQEINDKLKQVPNVSIVADVKDEIGMERIFKEYTPNVVFHAAAYKHVPLLEKNPREAVLNNVLGTKVISQLASENNVEKFIFISTDKAVNPTSVMGATKRVSENMLKEIHSDRTEFVSVRFGNVLDSRGSVIPIFKDQVRRGGPVTVTHPNMMRYFMSIHEAVFLVLQAGALGRGGEVFVLDMGKQVNILDLAKNIIHSFGFEPDKDIPIVYIGLRPGEKLYEEILTAEEDTTVTIRKKIFIAHDKNPQDVDYMNTVDNLINISKRGDSSEIIISNIKDLVPTYHRSQSENKVQSEDTTKVSLNKTLSSKRKCTT